MATLRGLEEDDYEAFWKELEREELGTGAKPPEGDSHLVRWGAGLSQLPDPALTPNVLVVLDLRHNKIREFSAQNIVYLTGLQHLDLTGNHIAEVPANVDLLANNLRALYLGRNRIECLPKELGRLTSLLALRLDHNRLWELPWELGYAGALEALALEHNRLTSLPPELALLSRLRVLGLRGNPLIPASSSRTRDCAPVAGGEVRISSFASDELEADTCFLSGRNTLAREGHDGLLAFLASQLLFQDFSNREIFLVPHAALRNTLLQELRLGYNGIEALPDELAGHTALRILDLSANSVSSFPPTLSTLVSLKELNLSRNLVANTAVARKHAEEMCIPPCVGEGLTALETLLLARNRLHFLPDAILSFQQLRVLDVSANQLNSTMPALTRGRPQLDAFPDLYASMPICLSLRVVNIAQNRIRILQDDSVRRLRVLEELVVESNLLDVLPPSIGHKSDTLTLLWAGQNRLTSIPATLGGLTRLRSLRLEKNMLRTIPNEIGRCSALEDLNLFNNTDLYVPPPDVVVGGCKKVVAFMQRLLMQGAEEAQARPAELLRIESGGVGEVLRVEDEDVTDGAGEGDSEEDQSDGLLGSMGGLELDTSSEAADYGGRPRGSGAGIGEEREVLVDAEGIPFLPAGTLDKPMHPVLYLNQECELVKVYTERGRVYCDVIVSETGRLLTRIADDMIM